MVREAATPAESAAPRNRAANQNTLISYINFGSLAAGHQTLDVMRESKQSSIVSPKEGSLKSFLYFLLQGLAGIHWRSVGFSSCFDMQVFR